MNLFQLGDFTLNSGAKSSWKLECDALTDDDWQALAKMVADMYRSDFKTVEGVPRGGLKLAAALEKYATPTGWHHLIVDDVLTTGGSMERAKSAHLGAEGRVTELQSLGCNVIGAVVFARGQCPFWIKPVLQMPECFWVRSRS